MPWCDNCAKYYAPSGLRPDGTCPVCGRNVGPVTDADRLAEGESEPTAKAPWHFWLLVIALTLYLGYRAVQGIAWLIRVI